MSQASLEDQLERYRRLLSLSQVLTSTLDLFALLDLIVNAARDLTHTEAASILLLDAKTGQLYFEAASGSKSEEVKREAVPADSVAGWVVREGQPLIIADVSRDTRFFAQMDERIGFHTRSLIAVPMKVKDRVIGALEAVNRVGDTPFSIEDIEMLTTLSAQAAVAIENARLFHQSDLISEMVHELRSPLTSIVAYSELLVNRPIEPDMAHGFIETIYQEAIRLSSMTNDFLELSRLQSGRVRLQMIAVDINPLVDDVITLLKPQADERGLQIGSRLPAQGVQVIGDRDRLRQVIVNLTSNAIKYNRPGGSVSLEVEPLAELGHVRISVRDTGKGIPAKDLPHIFEKFYRVADTEGTAPGTGLGLKIVKQIIDAHDSHITVDSEVNVGTTFSFTLKMAQ